MKAYLSSSISLVLLALAWPAAAQNPSPQPSTQAVAPYGGGATAGGNAVQDGIVFYNGQPYLIRNGQASVIDANLVPEGQILTNSGQFVPLPNNYNGLQPGMNGQRPGTVSTNGNVAPGTQTTQGTQGANSAAVLRDGRVGGETPNRAAGTSPGTNSITSNPSATRPSTSGGAAGQTGNQVAPGVNGNMTEGAYPTSNGRPTGAAYPTSNGRPTGGTSGGARSGTSGGTTGGSSGSTTGGSSGGTSGGGGR